MKRTVKKILTVAILLWAVAASGKEINYADNAHNGMQKFDSLRDSISLRVRLLASSSIHYFETDSFRNEVMRLFIKVFDTRKDFNPDDYFADIITSDERNEILQKMSSLRMHAFSLMNDLFYAYITGVSDGQDARDVDKQMMVCCMALSMISGSLTGFFIERARSIAARDTWYSYPEWYMIVSLFEILLMTDYYIRETQYADNPEYIEQVMSELTEEVIIKLTELNSYLTDILENHGHDVDMEVHIKYVNSFLQEINNQIK